MSNVIIFFTFWHGSTYRVMDRKASPGTCFYNFVLTISRNAMSFCSCPINAALHINTFWQGSSSLTWWARPCTLNKLGAIHYQYLSDGLWMLASFYYNAQIVLEDYSKAWSKHIRLIFMPHLIGSIYSMINESVKREIKNIVRIIVKFLAKSNSSLSHPYLPSCSCDIKHPLSRRLPLTSSPLLQLTLEW